MHRVKLNLAGPEVWVSDTSDRTIDKTSRLTCTSRSKVQADGFSTADVFDIIDFMEEAPTVSDSMVTGNPVRVTTYIAGACRFQSDLGKMLELSSDV